MLIEVASGCVALALFLASPALGIAQFGLVLGFWSVLTLSAPLSELAGDRAGLQKLLAGGKVSEDFCAGYLPLISWTTEFRPADWPPEWLPDPISSYYHHLDRGDLEKAAAQMNDTIKNQYWSLKNRLVCLEAAYFSARHENSPVEARGWLDRSKTGYPVERFVALRAEGAVLRAEGKYREAEARVAEGLRLLGLCQRTGWTLVNEALLRDLREVAAASRAPRTA